MEHTPERNWVLGLTALGLMVTACSEASAPSQKSDLQPHAAAALVTASAPAVAGAAGATAGPGAPDAPRASPDETRGWPTYGYDFDNSQYNRAETELHARNVTGLQEKWRVTFPGGATSTPVVYDGTVYFGGWDGRAYAADASTGELRWKTTVTRQYVRSTPAVTEDRVYVATMNELVALDRHDGHVVFQTRLDREPTTLIDASPRVIDGLVIIGVASGENTAFKDDYTFIGHLDAIDAETGELVWRVDMTGQRDGPCTGGAGVGVWSSPAFDRDLHMLYVGTGENYEFPAGSCEDSLVAIHYDRHWQGERVAWKAQFTADDVYLVVVPILGVNGDVGASPNLFEANGKPLVGVGDKPGSYRVFDRRTGELEWRVDLDHSEQTGLGGVMTTAAVDDTTIYVTSNHMLGLDGLMNSTLYALDMASGKERWQVTLPAPMFGSFALANSLLYHPTVDGNLYARETATGKALWTVNLANSIGAGPSVQDGRVYVSSGMAVTPDLSDVADGIIQSFGLPESNAGPSRMTDVGPVETPAPLTKAECQDSFSNNPAATPACTDCLCGCDATSWGNCPWCWTLSPCVQLLCAFAQPGDDLSQCMVDFCAAELVPPGQFELTLAVAPCVQKCARECAF